MSKKSLGTKRQRGTVLRKHMCSKTGEIEMKDEPVRVEVTTDEEVGQKA
jgi:predicted metalloprotease